MSDGTVNVSVRTGAPWWLWLIILALLAAAAVITSLLAQIGVTP